MTETPRADSASGGLALTVTGLTKRFAGTVALNEATLSVRRGTVHALLGGNGSGKSTAIKVLAGVYEADAGELSVMGVQHALHGFSSHDARAAGLRFVHQDLGLFEGLSIEENFAFESGYPLRRGVGIRWTDLRRRVRRVLADYELDIDPRTPINQLRPADRTMVAIARALQDQSDDELVLVLDEPTATLAEHESTLLLQRIRSRALRGQTAILVSHRLQEVLEVAQDFTVFRDGRTVACLTDACPSEDELVELMAGRAVSALRSTEASHASANTLLRLTDVHSGPLKGIDLDLAAGEIVGIAGLVGSGRSSLLRTIFGEHRITQGQMTFEGSAYRPADMSDAMTRGVALVPEDRGGEAAFASLSISDNLSVTVLPRYWRAARGMSRPAERAAAQSLLSDFRVKSAGPDAVFSSMSGGNQQKVILARWLQREPSLLLLDEPSQGVDVMSRADIYGIIRKAAGRGTAVLVASSDTSELCALCDRVVVLRDGRIAETVSGADLDPDLITNTLLRSGPSSSDTQERR